MAADCIRVAVVLYNVSVLSALDANLGEEEEEEDRAPDSEDGDRRLKKGTGIAAEKVVGVSPAAAVSPLAVCRIIMGQCTSRHGRRRNSSKGKCDEVTSSGEFDDAMAGGNGGCGRRYMTSDGNSEETDDEDDPTMAEENVFVIDFGGGELPSVAAAAARKAPDGLASRFRRREVTAKNGQQRAVSLGRDQARGGRQGRAKKPALPSSPSKRSSSSLSPAKSSSVASSTAASRQPRPTKQPVQKRRLMSKNKSKSGSSPKGSGRSRTISSACVYQRARTHMRSS